MNLKELFNRRADIRFCFIVISMLILSFLLNSCFHSSYDDYEERDIIYTTFNNDDQLEMHAYNYTKTFALFRVKIPDEYFDNSDGTISVNENSWVKHDDYYYYNGIIKYRDGIEDILYTFRPSDSLDGNSNNVRYKYDFYECEDNLEFVDVSEFEDIWSIIDKPKEVNMIEGQEFNQIIKRISTGNNDSNDFDENNIIKRIVINNSEVETDNCVNVSEDIIPINACFADDTVYLTTEADIIYLNENSRSLFYNLNALEEIEGFDRINTSKVIYMSSMFGNTSIKKIDFGNNFDTSNVENMRSMFSGSKFVELDLSNFNTSKVKDMSYMFYNSETTKINLSSFDTSSVLDMNNMFNNSKVKELDLSNFKTNLCTKFNNMFSSTELKRIDISNFDFSNANINSLYSMFSFNNNLEYLDISSIDPKIFDDNNTGEINWKKFKSTFDYIRNNPTIIVKNQRMKNLFINSYENMQEDNIKVKV